MKHQEISSFTMSKNERWSYILAEQFSVYQISHVGTVGEGDIIVNFITQCVKLIHFFKNLPLYFWVKDWLTGIDELIIWWPSIWICVQVCNSIKIQAWVYEWTACMSRSWKWHDCMAL